MTMRTTVIQSDEESPVIPQHLQHTRQSPDFYRVYMCMTKDTFR